MKNSYYIGVEDVSNTTIENLSLCPSCHIYESMEHVKDHDNYHNINDSQVTCQSPVKIWLIEAVTMRMERKRGAARRSSASTTVF